MYQLNMIKLWHLEARLCKKLPVLSSLILKKHVNFAIPTARYVTQAGPQVALDISTQKKIPKPEWRPTPSTDRTNIVSHVLKLSKIRLTSLVVVTTMAGYAVAPAPFEWHTFGMCLIGTGLLSCAANAVNQFHEVPFDAQMSRTKHRVLICGRLTPLQAASFAVSAGSLGTAILLYGVNGFTAALGMANLLLYTSIYTPMKRISILNTWVGSIVGAIPPLMGWAACCGELGPGAWLMAALLYSWQFPHFNALSWNLRPDYSRAGYRMMAVTDPGLCRRVALRHTVAIAIMSACAPLLDTTNWWFPALSAPLNLYFIYLAHRFYKDSNSGTSRSLFRYSLLHLPALMVLFLLSKKKWYAFEDRNELIVEPTSESVE